MKRILFITPEDSYPGFSLAGVKQLIARGEKLSELVEATVNDPDTGLLIIDERLLGTIEEEGIRKLEERWQGILLILPAPEKVSPEEDYMMRYIMRAIGYQIRITP